MAAKIVYEDMDKEYAAARNTLIPEAEKYANRQCGISCRGKSDQEKEEWYIKWNRSFHGKMNRLYAKKVAT